jgi:tripartite ATP-independent transporter DctM subunit
MLSMLTLDVMPPVMFGGLVIFLLIGFPVAFSLAATGLFFGFLSIEQGFFTEAYLGNLPLRVFGILSNDLLLAIPFFTLMGAILERCGLAEDLLEGTGQLFGKIPGGLAYAVILVGAVLGAITGTVAASVIAMGMISLPIMMRYGYDMRIATGVIAASGTITQVIPPSLVLIVLGDQLGKSVGDMYAGAIGPSILQVLLFILFIVGVSIFAPHKVPPLPEEALTQRGWTLWWRVLKGMVPSIVLIFMVLGTIFLGLATPTEAGAMGTVGAVVLAVVNGRFTWPLLRQAMESTMRITAMVIFILVGSTVFSLVFQGVDGSLWIEHMLSHLPGGQVGFLIFVNVFIFFLAFFLDFFEIAFIVIPLLGPVAAKLGIDLVWFGVLLCVNMQTSFMHPPFGFALFYLRGIAPKEVKSSDIYWGAIPWVVLQLILVAIVIFWPESVTYWLDKGTGIDPSTVRIEVPLPDLPEDDAPPVFR